MNNNELKKIEDRLMPPPAPEPPEGLLESIQKEIPEHLQLVDQTSGSTTPPSRLRLIAASIAVVVLGGVIAYRLQKESPSVERWRANQEQVQDRIVVETEPLQQPGRIEAEAPAAPVRKVGLDSSIADPSLSEGKSKVKKEAEVGANQDDLRALGYVGSYELDEKAALDALVEQKRSGMYERFRDLPTEPQDSANIPDDGRRISSGSSISQPELERVPQSQTVLFDTMHVPKTDTDQLAAEERRQRRDAPERSRHSGVAQREIREAPASPEEEVITVTSESPALGKRLPGESGSPSTGGTHEPNDAPYGDMFFKSYGTNPFIDTEDDNQSTFGLDVDTGSFTLARNYIERGHLPPGEAIRVEEFVNYFDYGDPAPRRGEFTITAEGVPSPFASGPRYQLVRFGIKGREISNAQRKPAMLIFVVDVSGSMRQQNRLELVKRSLELLLDQLRHDDQVGLVVYGSRGQVLLEPTSNRSAIERAIYRLQPTGSTNAEEGLTLAYDLARTYRRHGAINRVILCSDGVANVGRTGPESILQRIRGAADQGIELTTVGFGMGNYNDVLMEQLADQGDGFYAYVDTLDEARRIFVENLTGTLQTIASDAKVQVEFNPETVSRYRLLGYENRDIADEKFRDDTIDAGEIGAGHEVTALYEIKLQENVSKRDLLATIRLRYRSKATDQVVETAVDFSPKNIARRWENASSALRLSSIVAEFAEILKGSYWAKEGSLDVLHQRTLEVADDYRGNQDVLDLVYLIEQTRRLSPVSSRYDEE